MASRATYGEADFVSKFKAIFDLDLSEGDLKNCNSDLITKIYICFIRDFGASVEKLNQVPLEAPESVHQHSEMYKAVNFEMHLAKVVKYYLALFCEDNDFCSMDIFDPDWTRTKKFFTIFLDFYSFLSEKYNSIEDVENKVSLKKERCEKIMDSIESHKKEISRRKLQKAEDEICAEKLMRLIEDEKKALMNSQHMKDRLKGRLEGLKMEIMDLTNKKKEMELHVLEGQEKVKFLKSQVILDEEFVEIKERKEKLDEQKDVNDKLKEAIKELKDNLQIQKKGDSIIRNTLIPALQDYEVEAKRKDEALAMKQEAKKDISILLEKDEELSRTLQILNEKAALLTEERSQALSSREIKKAGLIDEIKQLKLTLEELQRSNEQHEIVEKDLALEHKQVLEGLEAEKQNMKVFYNDVKSFTASIGSEMKTLFEKDKEKLKNMPPPS